MNIISLLAIAYIFVAEKKIRYCYFCKFCW